MNKQFHQLAPILALRQMPDKFQAFFISEGYTEERLKTDADLPDMVDKDNITINSEIHHAHSFKLQEITGPKGEKYLDWLDGDCLQRLKALAADAHDFRAEGKLDMVRYALAKMTHYIVDGSGCTYPHNHRGRPWSQYHQSFEDDLGHFITVHQSEIGSISFEACSDIYKYCRKSALDMWHEGLVVVENLEKGIGLTDAQKLELCRKAIKLIGDIWLTLANELKLL